MQGLGLIRCRSGCNVIEEPFYETNPDNQAAWLRRQQQEAAGGGIQEMHAEPIDLTNCSIKPNRKASKRPLAKRR